MPLPLPFVAWPLPLPFVAWPLPPLCDGWAAWPLPFVAWPVVPLPCCRLNSSSIGLLGQSEDLADAVVEPLGILNQPGIELDFQVHAGTAGTVVVVCDLARDADVRFEGHIALLCRLW